MRRLVCFCRQSATPFDAPPPPKPYQAATPPLLPAVGSAGRIQGHRPDGAAFCPLGQHRPPLRFVGRPDAASGPPRRRLPGAAAAACTAAAAVWCGCRNKTKHSERYAAPASAARLRPHRYLPPVSLHPHAGPRICKRVIMASVFSYACGGKVGVHQTPTCASNRPRPSYQLRPGSAAVQLGTSSRGLCSPVATTSALACTPGKKNDRGNADLFVRQRTASTRPIASRQPDHPAVASEASRSTRSHAHTTTRVIHYLATK